MRNESSGKTSDIYHTRKPLWYCDSFVAILRYGEKRMKGFQGKWIFLCFFGSRSFALD